MGTSDLTELDPIIVDEDKVDLTKASYNENLSFTDMDEETQTFSISLDRILFKKGHEVILKVLEAHGYKINLENILASMDHFMLGVRVKLNSKDLQIEKPQVKHFIPALQFKLPAKHRVGEILQQFYNEIRGYETEIARLQGAETKKGKKEENPEEMAKELQKLRQENSSLKSKVEGLARKMALMEKSNKDASRALASHNILPGNIRLAQVRDIDTQIREVLLKAGRTNFSVPMADIDGLPKIGDQCLALIIDGKVKGIFFFESNIARFDVRLAEIVYIKDGKCKARDANRREFLLHANNDREKEIIARFKRGQKILAHFFENNLVRFTELTATCDDLFIDKVKEAITNHQLNEIYITELNREAEEMREDVA